MRSSQTTYRYSMNYSATIHAPSAMARQKFFKSYRASRSPVALGRRLSRTIITTFGRIFAVASTLYERPSAPGKIGRQTQTGVKFPEGWRLVVGHVSLIDKVAT